MFHGVKTVSCFDYTTSYRRVLSQHCLWLSRNPMNLDWGDTAALRHRAYQPMLSDFSRQHVTTTTDPRLDLNSHCTAPIVKRIPKTGVTRTHQGMHIAPIPILFLLPKEKISGTNKYSQSGQPGMELPLLNN